MTFGGNLKNFSVLSTIQDRQEHLWYEIKERLYNLNKNTKKWIYPSNFRNITFTDTYPSEYIFNSKGSNNNGILSNKDASFKFVQLFLLNQTWWDYSIHLIFICILIYIFVLIVKNRNKLKNELKEEHLQLSKQKEVDHLKSKFLANISHEFRTPLTLILGPVEKWLKNIKNGDLKNDLKMIYKNSLRISKLITQLLDLSRIDSGEMILKIRPENIVELLRGLVLSFSTLAKEKNINLSFISSNEIIIVYMDKDKIEDIVSNLIINAFKYTPTNGKISVSIMISRTDETNKESQKYVKINVRDSGTGIAEEQINNIFKRFYQTEGTIGITDKGVGIGLSVAKELTELHHGKISVRSKVNHGTNFTVLLPLGKNHFPAETIEKQYSREKLIIQSRKNIFVSDYIEDVESKKNVNRLVEKVELKDASHILIVEDNEETRSFLRKSLTAHYRISEASNGAEGLSAARDFDPNLILCDVMMPEMDGYELCRIVKTDQMISHIPVILLTAKATMEDKLEGLDTGADDYIFKPFNMAELFVRIKNLINQRKNLQKRFREEIVVQPGEITVTSVDKLFLQRAISAVEEFIGDPDFETQTLANEMGMCRMNMHRKIKALTGQTPSQFICTIRLKRAVQLIKKQSGNVTEIAYNVGFSSSSYFAKCFKIEFGIAPSEYAKNQSIQG
jgi:signal transduction histidine kinase/DNA-binding NarL/FixJ family response regulator